MPTLYFRNRGEQSSEPVSDEHPFPTVILEPVPGAVTETFTAVGTTGAIALSSALRSYRLSLKSVTCKFSSAPTTSESFTVTLNSVWGANFDTVLLSTNPSTTSATSIVYMPTGGFILLPGDQVDIAFTNTDARTYGVTMMVEVR